MSVCIDASVLIAASVDAGPAGAWAERVVSRGPLVAPHLVLVEATNILRRLELSGKISNLEASSAQRDILMLDLTLFAFEPFAPRVWGLRGNLTCYDAWSIAIAEALSVPLATLDVRLSRAAGPRCAFLLPN